MKTYGGSWDVAPCRPDLDITLYGSQYSSSSSGCCTNGWI